MPFNIIRHDITELEVDVIVNPINSEFIIDGGVCQRIFDKAGRDKLNKICQELPPLKTSQAAITAGLDLKSKYIIHTIGPVFNEKNSIESENKLVCTYQNCLEIASENKAESIAFPLISSGAFGFPKDKALEIARKTITEYVNNYEIDVILTIYDNESFTVSEKLLGDIESYINENYVCLDKRNVSMNRATILIDEIQKSSQIFGDTSCIEDVLQNLDDTFSQTLLKLIDIKGKTDVEVYKKANIDRKLFSKIRNDNGYNPSKKTVLALSISLELDLTQTNELLSCAGYSISHSKKFDVIVEYFIKNGNYDIFEINEVLFKYDEVLLGC